MPQAACRPIHEPMNETVMMEPPTASGTVEVTMPSPGIDAQVKVVAWLKHPGDTVSKDEAICVVQWADGSAEVGSPASGVLRMVTAAAGQAVTVGATLAVIDVATGRFTL